jgi:hypothetical protein
VEQRAGGGTGHWTSAAFARHGRRRCGLDFWPRETLPEMDEGHDGCELTPGPAGWFLLHAQASAARRAAARGPARLVARPFGVPGRGAWCGERGGGNQARGRSIAEPSGRPYAGPQCVRRVAARPDCLRARARRHRRSACPNFNRFSPLRKSETPKSVN